jgi:hypothetical protein
MTTLTTSETLNLLHTALHATRMALHNIEDDQRVTPENLFAARDCLRTATRLAAAAAHVELLRATRHALEDADFGRALRHVADLLGQLHETAACSLGGDERLLPPIASLSTVESLIPRGVMKHQARERFEWIPFVIVSHPVGPSVAVYGVFSVSLCALKRNQPFTIKQDFLVYERTARPEPIATYYSGWEDPTDARIQHIGRFCERFGPVRYGCRRDDEKWVCDNHWYTGPDDDRLPIEPPLRKSIRESVERGRARLADVDCSKI